MITGRSLKNRELPARACPTIPARSRIAGDLQVSPSLRHQAPPWGQGRAEAGPGHGPAGEGQAAGPCPGRAGMWGAGDQPCCGDTGAGADGPRADGMGFLMGPMD